jgi:hypothetical protein
VCISVCIPSNVDGLCTLAAEDGILVAEELPRERPLAASMRPGRKCSGAKDGRADGPACVAAD